MHFYVISVWVSWLLRGPKNIGQVVCYVDSGCSQEQQFLRIFEHLNHFGNYLGYSLGDIKNALQNSLVIQLVVALELIQVTKIRSKLVAKALAKSVKC